MLCLKWIYFMSLCKNLRFELEHQSTLKLKCFPTTFLTIEMSFIKITIKLDFL